MNCHLNQPLGGIGQRGRCRDLTQTPLTQEQLLPLLIGQCLIYVVITGRVLVRIVAIVHRFTRHSSLPGVSGKGPGSSIKVHFIYRDSLSSSTRRHAMIRWWPWSSSVVVGILEYWRLGSVGCRRERLFVLNPSVTATTTRFI